MQVTYSQQRTCHYPYSKPNVRQAIGESVLRSSLKYELKNCWSQSQRHFEVLVWLFLGLVLFDFLFKCRLSHLLLCSEPSSAGCKQWHLTSLFSLLFYLSLFPLFLLVFTESPSWSLFLSFSLCFSLLPLEFSVSLCFSPFFSM